MNLPKSSNTATASTGSSSSTIKSQILKCTFKTLCFFLKKRKTPWNFGYSREDTGQATSWGKSLANSSPTFPARLPKSEPDSCLGRKLFLSQLLTISLYSRTSLLGIFTINWVSETTSIFVLVRTTELKTKQKKGSWLVEHE